MSMRAAVVSEQSESKTTEKKRKKFGLEHFSSYENNNSSRTRTRTQQVSLQNYYSSSATAPDTTHSKTVEEEQQQQGQEEQEELDEGLTVPVQASSCSPVDSLQGGRGCEVLLRVVDELVEALSPLTFKAPVAFVYNPLVYAREPHEDYVRKYGGRKVEVLLVGMNPGPFGMAQTGVPFGDSVFVRDFLHVTGKVQSPESMHPKRPILGLTCPRREVSGQRLWGWVQARFGSAAPFFERFWVHNYCPLLFVEASGKNRTPDKLTAIEKDSVISACNMALRAVMALLQPRLVVGVGKYAGQRVKECAGPGVQVGDIMHPSPANPKANKDWDMLVESQLQALGVDL
ncbi:unnamed protein product [Sphagnum balticum]